MTSSLSKYLSKYLLIINSFRSWENEVHEIFGWTSGVEYMTGFPNISHNSFVLTRQAISRSQSCSSHRSVCESIFELFVVL